MTIDPSIKENYRDLHESTGESYESIAGRVAEQGDRELAGWLRQQAAGTTATSELEARTEPPRGRTAAKQETASAETQEAADKAAADAAAQEAADKAAADAAAKEAADKAAAEADKKESVKK
jgi:hypothetical protein